MSWEKIDSIEAKMNVPRIPTDRFIKDNGIKTFIHGSRGMSARRTITSGRAYCYAEYGHIIQKDEIPYHDHGVFLKSDKNVWLAYCPYDNIENIKSECEAYAEKHCLKCWTYDKSYSWYGFGTCLIIMGLVEPIVKKYTIEEATERFKNFCPRDYTKAEQETYFKSHTCGIDKVK